MLDHPGSTICFGEPPVLNNLTTALEYELMSEEELKQLLEASINCLRAHVPLNQTCVLKTTAAEAKLVRLCHDIPHLKHIFMTRKNGLQSMERLVRRFVIIM